MWIPNKVASTWCPLFTRRAYVRCGPEKVSIHLWQLRHRAAPDARPHGAMQIGISAIPLLIGDSYQTWIHQVFGCFLRKRSGWMQNKTRWTLMSETKSSECRNLFWALERWGCHVDTKHGIDARCSSFGTHCIPSNFNYCLQMRKIHGNDWKRFSIQNLGHSLVIQMSLRLFHTITWVELWLFRHWIGICFIWQWNLSLEKYAFRKTKSTLYEV